MILALVYGRIWDIRTGRHCVFVLHAHLVFLTKFRHPVFTGAHLERMEQIMRDVCTDWSARSRRWSPCCCRRTSWAGGPRGCPTRSNGRAFRRGVASAARSRRSPACSAGGRPSRRSRSPWPTPVPWSSSPGCRPSD
ncbi:hypothetical protein B1L11_21025 [Microbispora sp. GKU 823]|nr:hypothetical protein B1L11_21025 [Microbispora sp. GKU 823]